jgi:hypothetical protein
VESSASAVTVGKNHYVYCYYDATAQELGVGIDDGAVTTASATGGINTITTPTLRIGIDINDVSEFDGVISDMVIMHEVPTTDEITYFWNHGLGRRTQEIMLQGPDYTTAGLSVNALDGLAMLYTLDEVTGDRQDSTGRGNIVEDNNGVTSDAGAVGSGSAAVFDGSTEFLNNTEPPNDFLPQDTSVGTTDWTMAVWVNADTLTGDMGIFGNYSGVSNGGLYLEYDQSQDRFRVRADNGTGTWSVDADNHGAVSTTTWYFVVGQYEASAKKFYISVNDGTADTGTHTGLLVDGTGDLEIGVNSPGAIYWDGKIDQPLFYWRKISAEEITWHYNSGSGREWSEFFSLSTPDPGDEGIFDLGFGDWFGD